MKRVLLLFTILVIFCLAGGFGAVYADNNMAIRVGIYENKPKIFTDEQGNAAGFWPDITSYIASKEGWKIEWVHGTWMQCLERLKNNEIDIMPDVAYTEERDTIYDYSQVSVYTSWSRVYTNPDYNIESILDLEGKNIAVLAGSINFIGPEGIKTLTESFCISCNFIPVDSYIEVFELIDRKEADAGVVSKDFAYTHQSGYSIIETPIIFQPALLYFAFPPESNLKPYLMAEIDNWIGQLKADGGSIYYQSLKNWIGTSPIETLVVPDWVKWMLIGIGSVVIVLGGGTLVLRTEVRRKTKELADDIARREQMEKRLRESEEKLSSVLETMPLGLVVLDLEGKIMRANRKALQMGSYNNQDLVGKSYLDFVVKKDQVKAMTNIKNALEIGFSGSAAYALLNKNGEELLVKVDISLIKDHKNNPAGFVTVIEDMTVQKPGKK